ncbi:MAG TPA: adenylate/guanylate cyclase domain-containing protein [Propionibacteriaceae bacterium]
MATISAQQLADLVPCSLDDVRRLQGLGLLVSEDGRYESAAVHLVRLMDAFEEAGVSVEDVARGVAAGELSFPLGLFMPELAARSTTFEKLGEELGRSPELLRRLSFEVGLPPSDDDRVRDEDAEILKLIMTRLDLASDEELSRFARLYGGTVQRLVSSGLQFFDQTVRQRVAAFDDLSNKEKDALVYQEAAGFTELVASIVPWLQQRHREHSVLAYVVSVTEGFMEQRGITPPQPKQPPAIAFLDLTGYTAVTEEHGDQAAAELAAGLAGVVNQAAQAHDGRAIKWLGDGVMFHFTDPGRAILGALDLVEQTEQAIGMPARMGVNAGTVIAQEGDYFGRTVNIAARIADYAQPHEVLVSEDARQVATADGVEFQLIGDVPLKGVSHSVRLHRVLRQ